MIKFGKRIATGQPPDIAKVVRCKDSQAWNVLVKVDDCTITIAAIDKGHADNMCDALNEAAWVSVHRDTVRS